LRDLEAAAHSAGTGGCRHSGDVGAPVLGVAINKKVATVDIMDHLAIATSQRREEGEAEVGGCGEVLGGGCRGVQRLDRAEPYAKGMDAEEGRRVERTHAVVEVADDDDVAECG
jgi:hypothetical protein